MKNSKLIFILLLLVIAGYKAGAQQDAMYTQYMFNQLALNPAVAGSKDVLSATALYRRQWVGVPGAPQTQTLAIDAPVPGKKIGLGLLLSNDKVGITRTTNVFGNYAFKIEMDKGTLALGIRGGASFFRADFTSVDLNGNSPNDPGFMQNVKKALLNFGAGVYYTTDRLYLGVSIPHLLNNTLQNNSAVVTNQLISREYLHLFVIGGYVFDLNEDLKLKPSFLFKGSKGAPIELDLNANFWLKEIVGVGLSYRSKADISIMAEVQATPRLRFGYAYDRSTTQLVKFNSGSHELMLKYELPIDMGGKADGSKEDKPSKSYF
ncbi:type IX secretion system membrane protein, PorP/SprF family [Filimonas lacunae]|uniref:Type IX secretion system membrane protein, PorP/SprF family n=1 Tax=Filimonas lacunae TaxID=477680 RepID=A0A173MBG0_9BACT|nr:type IX secretion system membrane protein PorP/SprF [Filimonas lacunae]BAV04821.1 hypothetical protein FLA_0820 [Filimonas lacunae]SIT34711.1 type IX secretion system membrane protein, PorP/SprF family [Filimonas lacunae]